MTKAEQRLVNYMNGTGLVQGMRQHLRESLPAGDANELERTLDAIIERAIEIAHANPYGYMGPKARKRSSSRG